MANVANEPLQPILDLKNALSVLISSDFLQMHDLVKECISYVVLNLNDVVRLPIDMNCINQKLIWMIAQRTPLDFLCNLHDKRDRLQSRLLKTKFAQFIYLHLETTDRGATTYLTAFLFNSLLHSSLDDALARDSDVNVYSSSFSPSE